MDSMPPCICPAVDDRILQNVVRISTFILESYAKRDSVKGLHKTDKTVSSLNSPNLSGI